ncbi:MAG: RNA-dependent DNA polymerase [Deferribacteres bacterium]|nr:RNA-dependent DNA polymerase [Deferribacteres bacterium]
MAKHYKNLYPQIHTFENLWSASRKARLGKRKKLSTAEFEHNLEENLFEIQHALAQEDFHFSPYRFFTIREPQERLIAAAPYRDRVVHHAICNVIEPILDSIMVFDSYACRKDKGSHKAVQRAQSFLQKSKWFLKIDLRKYFFSIDHQLLLADLAKKLCDKKLMRLISQLLATYSSLPLLSNSLKGELNFQGDRAVGLPIGNLTSQLFANYFLTPLDRFIKEKLLINYSIRYMDDIILFSRSKQELQTAKFQISNFLTERRLCMHQDKSQIAPAHHGLRFLGFHIYPHTLKISRPNLQRFKIRMRRKSYLYNDTFLDWEHVLQSLNGWLGYARQENNSHFINLVLRNLRFRHPEFRKQFSFILV